MKLDAKTRAAFERSGKRGGIKRKEVLSKTRRSEIAAHAVNTRWDRRKHQS